MKQKSPDNFGTFFMLIFLSFYLESGPADFFSKILFSSFTKTVPLILKAIIPFSLLTALVSTVMVLLIGPGFILYCTSITPFFPGKIGSVGLVGTVQPQLLFASLIIKGSLPVLVNSKVLFPESTPL